MAKLALAHWVGHNYEEYRTPGETYGSIWLSLRMINEETGELEHWSSEREVINDIGVWVFASGGWDKPGMVSIELRGRDIYSGTGKHLRAIANWIDKGNRKIEKALAKWKPVSVDQHVETALEALGIKHTWIMNKGQQRVTNLMGGLNVIRSSLDKLEVLRNIVKEAA